MAQHLEALGHEVIVADPNPDVRHARAAVVRTRTRYVPSPGAGAPRRPKNTAGWSPPLAHRESRYRQGMKLDTKTMTNPKPTTNPAIMMK